MLKVLVRNEEQENIMKRLQHIILFAVLAAAALMAVPTFAQDSTPSGNPTKPTSKTFTITQAQINERIQNRQGGERITDLSIVLGSGQINVSFNFQGRKDSTAKAVAAVVSPTVVDGRIQWNLSSLTIDGTAATQDQIKQFTERIQRLVGGRFNRPHDKFTVESITVTSEAITIVVNRK